MKGDKYMFDVELMRLEMQSPFAIHENEILVDEESEQFGKYINLNQFQMEIVKAANVMLFVTRQLLKKYLIRQGVEFNEKSLTKQLKRLSLNNYLSKKTFISTDGGESVTKIYTLGRKGKGFLRNMGIRVKLEGYINDRTPGQVKKILAANQAMLEIAGNDKRIYIETARIFLLNEGQPKITGMLFRALGYMNNKEEGKSYFIQPVRNEKDDVKELLDKLYRMEQVIKKTELSELKIKRSVTVIIVAENKKWMEYIENLLENEQKNYRHFQLAMTYDRLIVSENLPLDKKIRFLY